MQDGLQDGMQYGAQEGLQLGVQDGLQLGAQASGSCLSSSQSIKSGASQVRFIGLRDIHLPPYLSNKANVSTT